MKFNSDFAENFTVNHVVKFDDMRRVNFVREENFSCRTGIFCARNIFAADDGSRVELENFFRLGRFRDVEISESRPYCRDACRLEKISPADIHDKTSLNQSEFLKIFGNEFVSLRTIILRSRTLNCKALQNFRLRTSEHDILVSA